MRLLRLSLIALAFPLAAAAAGAFDPTAAAVDWLSQVTDQINALVTVHGDELVHVGQIELAFFGLITLVSMVVRWQTAHMVIGFRPVNYTIGDLFTFLLQLVICSIMLTYYNSPIPGTTLSVHQLLPEFAKNVANVIDESLLDGLLDRVREAISGTSPAGPFDFSGTLVYFGTLLLLAVMDLIMFAVNSFGFIALGLFVFFGPLIIPLFITRAFRARFWTWVDGMIVFSMFRAVAAAISFIFLNVLVGFFDGMVRGDYSLGHWLALLPALALLVAGFAWAMFKTPALTGMLFGGVASYAQQFTDTALAAAGKAASALAHS